jgi:hypothetical protein
MIAVACAGALTLGCETKHDEKSFRKAAEEAYREVNAGWMIDKRTATETIFVRGDQLDRLPVAELFKAYQASQKSGGDFFDAWKAEETKRAEARRRTVEQAKDEVIPILKSGSWVKVQDLGAIGPARMRDQIRPWRKEVATDLYVVLGVPEAKLGYRLASVEEMAAVEGGDAAWLERAVKNLVRLVGTSTSGGASLEDAQGRLRVLDMPNTDGVAALILDPGFRAKMLELFDQPSLGAAAPNRNVLILFDGEDFTTTKPVRARTHQLYDSQNHPAFRGLLKIEKDAVSVMEAANPQKK